MLAELALQDIPVGGKTPLSAGLRMAYEVIRKEKLLHPDIMPLLIVLTLPVTLGSLLRAENALLHDEVRHLQTYINALHDAPND